MNYLFYGENSYLIREKVKAFEDKYRTSQGNDAIIEKLDGESLTKSEIMEAVFALSFFSNKKLVEIKNILLSKSNADLRDFVTKNLDKVPEDTVIIFIEEGAPDQRTALFKALNKPRYAQQFINLTPIETAKYAKQKIKEQDGDIQSGALQRLVSYVGGDLWRLNQEIEKLVLWRSSKADKTITTDDIETFVWAENNQNVFDFIDALAGRNQQKSLTLAHQLISAGENEQYLLSMMVYQYRQLLIIKDLLLQNVPVANIASQAKIHPFVVKKSLPLLQRYEFTDLKDIYQKIEDCDAAIKSGDLEAGLALDVLLLDICKK